MTTVTNAFAKNPTAKQLATKFVENVDNSAMGKGDEVASIGITCPVRGTDINPFIGAILITHVDYDYAHHDEQRGVLMMKKPVGQPDGPIMFVAQNTGDSWDGPILGMDLQFDQPNGTIYITVLKNGKAEVSVGAKGQKPGEPLKCRVIPFDAAR